MKNFISHCYEDRPAPLQRYFQPFGMLLIFIIGWIFTQDIAQHIDLLFWDEANYMASGMSMFDKFNKAWGPTYAFWYKFLSFFKNDSIQLYYLNYRLMTIFAGYCIVYLAATIQCSALGSALDSFTAVVCTNQPACLAQSIALQHICVTNGACGDAKDKNLQPKTHLYGLCSAFSGLQQTGSLSDLFGYHRFMDDSGFYRQGIQKTFDIGNFYCGFIGYSFDSICDWNTNRNKF